ncbi:MAG: ATP-binding protein [Methylocystis sp.]
MDGSQQDLENGARAAACVAADPVFSALEASGAPVIAASGDPLRIAFLNDPARAVFGDDAESLADRLFRGDDPGARRLAELGRGRGLRLERLALRVFGQSQTLTFLCRRIEADDGAYFIIAALGVRADAAAEDRRVAGDSGEGESDETAALRRDLAARHGARAPRFLWKADAEGRFVDATLALADVVGQAADILGRSVQEVSRALALDPAFARAVASRRAWSGVEVDWPLQDNAGYVPTTLGALQITDAKRRFLGYQGYGVLHIDRARAARPAETAPRGSGEEASDAPLGDNVIRLRAPGSAHVEADAAEALSSSERLAFEEIARALTEGDLGGSEAGALAESTREPASGPRPATQPRSRESLAPGPEQTALALARTLEEKLARTRSENALLGAAFDLSRTPLAIMSADGTITRASAQFAAFFGAEARALESRSLASLLNPADAQLLTRLSPDARPGTSERLSVRRAAPDWTPLELKLRRLQVEGKPMLLASIESREDDVSDDRALEAARRAAESASAAKSDFLTRVSHEIRTPLNAIIGFADVMMEERFGPIGSPRYREYLKDMHASGEHVLSLVNDLLDLSKIEAGKMELSFSRVDANAVIAECASIMQAQANQGRVLMRLALAPDLPMLRADTRSLRQILLNLLSNAVKFNEPGGQVIISSALNDAGAVVIRVKDTGIGMSDEDVAMALEPFRQVDTLRKASGTGLGLPLTKALIEANHASFSIESRHRQGTLIEIAFPPPQVLAAE